MIALERLLQREGFGSRKECRRLVRDGLVVSDGQVCDDPEQLCAGEGTRLRVDGIDWVCRDRVVLMLHKPTGYECSRTPTHHPGVLSLLPSQFAARGVQPVGRLDAETSGLLILTDEGALNHALTAPRRKVAKRYRVTLKHPAGSDFAATLLRGVVLRDDPAPVAALSAVALDALTVDLTVDEGRYHLVRRMVAAAGNRVDALQRVAIGGLELPADLPPCSWRPLDAGQIALLMQA